MMRENRPPIDLSSLRPWSFLSSHGHLLLAVAQNPKATVAKLAEASQITERSAYRILADLQNAGYVHRHKVGRHNRYEINAELPLRDAVLESELVRDLLRLDRHVYEGQDRYRPDR